MGRIIIFCHYCGTQMERWPSEVYKTNFCSKRCHGAFDHAAKPFSWEAWYAANRERLIAKAKRWSAGNHAKRLDAQARYRLTHRKTTATHAVLRRSAKAATAAQVQEVMAYANGRCSYCGRPTKLEIDHIRPVKHGGSGHKRNLIPACRGCNAKKGTKDLVDWLYEAHGVEGLARAYMFMKRTLTPETRAALFL